MGENVVKKSGIHIALQFKTFKKWCTVGMWHQRNGLKCIKVIAIIIVNMKTGRVDLWKWQKILDTNTYGDAESFKN